MYHRLNTACLFTITRQWLTQSTPLRSPRRSQAQTNKGRDILGSSSKRRLVCLKQGNNVRSRLDWDIYFFSSALPPPAPPPPLWKAILCSFCCRHYWRMHPRGPKWGSWWGEGRGFKCQLSVNPIQTLQNVAGSLKKTEAAFYCLYWRWGGGGRGRECRENGISNWIFSPPPFFKLTITPLKWPKNKFQFFQTQSRFSY